MDILFLIVGKKKLWKKVITLLLVVQLGQKELVVAALRQLIYEKKMYRINKKKR